ncbi:unnamed protein product [Somion occarium]|uniref:Uncharacterized protein n=1 Tax=Somion occarium TaxID=3059160 RepID=A0ABP1E7X2_9APHY
MAKKNPVFDHQKSPITSMSHAQPRIVDVVENTNNTLYQDDDDDICPVCESECTCRNRATTSTLPTPSTSSVTPPVIQDVHPLKIKLTLPPHFKSRRLQAPAQISTENTGGVPHVLPGALPPRRRGRPSKAAIAARDAAVRAQTAVNGYTEPLPVYRPKTKATHVSKPRKPRLAGTFISNHASSSRVVVPPTPADDSDFDDVHSETFPTFVSAASSSHSSSSESDESITSIDSEGEVDSEDDEARPLSRSLRHKIRTKKDLLVGDEASRKRKHTNNWEIKSRMRSEGPEDAVMDVDSDGASSIDGADDEDEEEEEANEEDVEADVENEGLGEPEPDDEDEPPLDGKLGVSFGGVTSGWSEDEESSFDADLFFAHLEDSSDSDSSPNVLHDPEFASDAEESDADFSRRLSADERDALLLTDVDPSAHTRRGNGELEFGLSLHGLSFGWDGQLLLSRQMDAAHLDVDLGVTTEDDIDMTAGSDSETTADETTHVLQDAGIILEETDGETTEDELVDADGLPNPRAMMLFRWPTTVSAINPLSTMSSSNHFTPPADASTSVRIALASFPAQRSSPPPTPADILAGKVSNGDLDELEMKQMQSEFVDRPKRGGVVMGSFVMATEHAGAFAVVDGSGQETPAAFPRIRILRKPKTDKSREDSKDLRSEIETNDNGSQDVPPPSDSVPPSSSDEVTPQSQTQESEDCPDAFDLGDVLETSFLDLEPVSPERSTTDSFWSPGGFQSDATHSNNLNRWDRIPVATFRRTRETATLDYPGSDTSVGGNLVGTPLAQSILKSRDKQSKGGQDKRKGKRAQKLVISPVLLPLRDGDGVLASSEPPFSNQDQSHHHKSRKERKENAKKKAMGKYASRRFQQHQQQNHNHHHHHHHYPNMKSRGSSSMQRTNFFASSSSSVPHLSI